MTKVYFTADTHFNHANVLKYCACLFASIDEMNRVMIARVERRYRALNHEAH